MLGCAVRAPCRSVGLTPQLLCVQPSSSWGDLHLITHQFGGIKVWLSLPEPCSNEGSGTLGQEGIRGKRVL